MIIQAKSDELLCLSENFTNKVSEDKLLKQAVINLKEIAVSIESELCQLEEEKEKIVETSRGKETKNQALQETNMQLSIMWRKN